MNPSRKKSDSSMVARYEAIDENHILMEQVAKEMTACFVATKWSKRNTPREYRRGSYDEEVKFYKKMSKVCTVLKL